MHLYLVGPTASGKTQLLDRLAKDGILKEYGITAVFTVQAKPEEIGDVTFSEYNIEREWSSE